MKAEFVGKLVRIKEPKIFGRNNSKQVEFHCEEDDPSSQSKYPNILPFVCKYDPTYNKFDDTKALEKLSIGDKIKFSFSMKGREWQGPNDKEPRVFCDNRVVSRIVVLDKSNNGNSGAPVEIKMKPNQHHAMPSTYDEPMDDEMPF